MLEVRENTLYEQSRMNTFKTYHKETNRLHNLAGFAEIFFANTLNHPRVV
jgi:hypothetical protein